MNQAIGRRRRPTAGDQIGVRQGHVAADHFERRVAEDPLEADHVATVEQVELGQRVAEPCVKLRAPKAGFELGGTSWTEEQLDRALAQWDASSPGTGASWSSLRR
jgi:hypothetical protein